jgi:hypothetical protein
MQKNLANLAGLKGDRHKDRLSTPASSFRKSSVYLPLSAKRQQRTKSYVIKARSKKENERENTLAEAVHV